MHVHRSAKSTLPQPRHLLPLGRIRRHRKNRSRYQAHLASTALCPPCSLATWCGLGYPPRRSGGQQWWPTTLALSSTSGTGLQTSAWSIIFSGSGREPVGAGSRWHCWTRWSAQTSTHCKEGSGDVSHSS